MQLNQYSTYSLISQTENKNCNEMQKVFLFIDIISKIKNINKAKEFLKQNYQIKDPIKQFPLGTNSFLEVIETTKKYTLRISYTDNNENKCVIFNYKK